mmetsp:Transcript_4394/g.15410  ORF Transcript_4394/g.15410 Transcript_4394/m.15410 type:complete len:305 (+) Transcript_4394:92-1006(+)
MHNNECPLSLPGGGETPNCQGEETNHPSTILSHVFVLDLVVGVPGLVGLNHPVQGELAVGREHEENGAHSQVGCRGEQGHVVQHGAHEEVEWDPEDVDDRGPRLLGHVSRPHLHDARPEQADAGLEHAKGKDDDLPGKGQQPFAVRGLLAERGVGDDGRHEETHGRHDEDVLHVGLDRNLVIGQELARNARADHGGQHEDGEDDTVGDGLVVGRDRRGPHEHEGVHGGLEERLDDPQQQDLPVLLDLAHGGVEALHHGLLSLAVAVVLGPGADDHAASDGEHDDGGVERGDLTLREGVHQDVAE